MSKLISYAVLGLTRPAELRALLQYGIFRDSKDITADKATGYERPAMRRCWEFLPKTSRSFAAVTQELDDDLCRVVCLFYLVLRGLDTVEDDMTLDLDLKVQTLESFHEKLSQPGWNFKESGPNESDRQLLVEFEKVISEVMLLDDRYKSVITRVCKAMGAGMAHYAKAGAASSTAYAVDTLADFDLYCHYVAGIVGEGLSGLFSASGKEIPELARMLTLSNNMGLMLQKTNITRDFREDLEDGRFFWPKEIWGKYSEDPRQFYLSNDPEMHKKGLYALNEMILDTLVHSVDCLNYLSLIKNQSIFNFCAIPQVMAIATSEVCFNNPDVFKKNVKIRKSLALLLIGRATNPHEVGKMFLEYTRKIVARCPRSDPSYLRLCIICGHIEQWLENTFPSWVFDVDGKIRSPLPQYQDERAAQSIEDARVRQLPKRPITAEDAEKMARFQAYQAREAAAEKMPLVDYLLLLGFVFAILFLILFLMGIALLGVWWFNAPDASLAALRSNIAGFAGNFAQNARKVGIPIVGNLFARTKGATGATLHAPADAFNASLSGSVIPSATVIRQEL